MTQLLLIGIGTGNPDHVTLAGVRALNTADLVLLPRKGESKSDLVDLRRMLCRSLLEPDSAARIVEFDLPRRDDKQAYLDAVDEWHGAISSVWADLIERYLPAGGRVAMLIWGDPSLYDSSLRIAERLQQSGMAVQVKVVPGITSLQVLTAEHRIPLNTLAEPVQITTGRRLRERGWPDKVSTVAVMLDGCQAFEAVPPEDTYIWWGAYLGMHKQCLIEGWLADVRDRIVQQRAQLRREHGWIMDIYLMKCGPRKPPDHPDHLFYESKQGG